jgi:hypothetical protein
MKSFLTTGDQDAHLRIARGLTRSKDFMPDAEAIAGYTLEEGATEPRLRTICVLENKTVNSAWMHFAGVDEKWPVREIMSLFFRYVFLARNFQTILAPIPETNTAAQIVALKTGFRFEARMRAGTAHGSDAILLSLKPEHCRWMQDVTSASIEAEV